ncbi:uncharacterized protein LOC134815460 [Bolinopsis microptera]|uniref:uncharacterized protein LOC134815460 n=1 Tax=Bolinopsis microptera TaxID=2820187 RepID=UPI00307A42A5
MQGNMADKLTEEQISEFKEVFTMFQKDGDGTILSSDLGDAMRALYQHPTESQLSEVVQEVENGHGGKVDFPEFIEILVKNMSETDAEEELLEAFKILDPEGFGYVNSAEMRNVLTTLGEKLSDDDLDDMIKEGDSNDDGRIDFEMLARIMTAR